MTSINEKRLQTYGRQAAQLETEIKQLDTEARTHMTLSRDASIKANAKRTELAEVKQNMTTLEASLSVEPAKAAAASK